MNIEILRLFAPALSAVVTLALIRLILGTRFGRLIQDIPNHRSMHLSPIPRSGGIAVMLGIFAGWQLVGGVCNPALCVSLLTLIIVSLVDDLRGLSAKLRLLVQVAVASFFVIHLSPILSLLMMLILVVAIVWMTNLYNFIDGIDGLMGSMTTFGFGTYAVAAIIYGETDFVLVNAVVAAAACAFLIFNLHPAKIFMGDVGSIPIGFLSAAFGVIGWQQGVWPFWFPLMVFFPFILDATVTLVRRYMHGQNIFEAHREHYFQRLVLMGLSHSKVTFIKCCLMLVVDLIALVLIDDHLRVVMMVFAALLMFFGLLMMLVDTMWEKH